MKTKKIISRKRSLALIFLLCIVVFSCNKQAIVQEETNDKMEAMNASASLGRINLEDVMAKLPASIIYNLGTDAKFDLDHVAYANTENYLIARIPTNGHDSYVYVTQRNNDPAIIDAYLVKFIPNASATGSGFSGRQMWINLQDMHMYGIEFKNEVAVSFLTPIKLARPDWEACASVTNQLVFNQSTNKYTIAPFPGGSLPATTMNDPLDCPGENSFWDKLGDFFSGFAGWVGDLFGGGIGGDGGGPGSGSGGWVGGGSSYGPGGSGWNGGGTTGWGDGLGGGGSGHSGENWNGPNPGNIEGGNMPVYNGGVKGAGNVTLAPNALKKSLITNRLNAIKGPHDEWSFQDVPAGSPNMTGQEVQDLLTQPETIEPPNVFNSGPQTKVILVRIKYFPGMLGVDFNVTLHQGANGFWEYGNTSSTENGTPIWFLWTQVEAFSNPSIVSTNWFEVDVIGYQTLYIGYEGIGTIYKKRRHYRLIISREYGALITFETIDD